MPTIKKINLPDGSSYDIQDANAIPNPVTKKADDFLKYNGTEWTTATIPTTSHTLEGSELVIETDYGGDTSAFATKDYVAENAVGLTGDNTIAGIKTFTNVVTANGFNANNNKLTKLATPTANTDAANKSYVDTSISNLNLGTTSELVKYANSVLTTLGGAQIDLSGGAKIETGSYVGTGTYGSANPCSLTFSFLHTFFKPKIYKKVSVKNF